MTTPPKNVLYIGCGLAFESELFQRKYNCKLFLLDGDFESSKDATRDRKYGPADTMAFYTKVPELLKSFDERNLKYTFVDANDIKLPPNLVFDLVYSNVSCEFHYPIGTYINLLKKYTDKNSTMIFDVNSRYLEEQVGDLFEVIETKNYPGQKKIIKCKIKIKV